MNRKRTRWSCSALMVALEISTSISLTLAEEAEVFHFKGLSAFAIFSTTEGCIVTDVIVSATEGTTHSPPQVKETLSAAFLTIFRFDVCAGEQLLDIAGDVPLAAKAFTGNQKRARLQATIDVYDRVSDSFFDVVVDVKWTGTGALVRDRNRIHDVGGGCIVNSHIMGTSREAQAVGSVTVHGTNVAPAPSEDAMVMTAKEGTASINCPEPG